MQAAAELRQMVGVQRVCQALGIPHASYYRKQRTAPMAPIATVAAAPKEPRRVSNPVGIVVGISFSFWSILVTG